MNKIMAGAFLVFIATLVLLKGINFKIPYRDSGGVLYGGREVLLGRLPYRDFWDHKAPLIYYIDAAALAVNSRNLWSIWGTEWISLFGTFLIMFYVINRKFNKTAAFASITICAIAISKLLDGGNRVEEYGLFFQALAVLLFGAKRRNYALGVVSGCLFLLKPNMAAIFPAIMIYLFIKGEAKEAMKLSAGFMTIPLLFLVYFGINAALGQMADQVIVFNMLYSEATGAQRFSVLTLGSRLLAPVLIATIPGLMMVLVKRKTLIIPDIIQLALIWLPLEIAASVFSGREYLHYYLIWIIPLLLLVSYTFYQIKFKYAAYLLMFLIIFTGYKNEAAGLIKNAYTLRPFDKRLQFRGFNYNNFDEHSDTLEAIAQGSEQNDNILIWGSEPALPVLSGRQSKNKYYYQFRLLYPGYDTDSRRLGEFLDELIMNPPELIVDAAKSTNDSLMNSTWALPPLNQEEMSRWIADIRPTPAQTKTLTALSEFISTRYRPWRTTYQGKWMIYKRN
ncbi:MAG: hypothetical protein UX87_C0007G0013 [Candidatus Amesbacteria bacterium GW2011_GWA1_47_16]|uniref:Glycosyltransferase RgtA/B/C/D-like domain-containing protein n=4 Tax=Candidatus Amesiibacteriota TaxID=1752730 RepID=A0A0G1UDS5_9BACT|nr:MAG: hypothetical protein UX86_C0010G0003 [Candidatus Amesbacteria bacterium GW2011_GWC1_47_15]KKU64505.1 MAG: hypothetical protein UX87_C0007G0013 [Candidatus Amesbacteria bacterium GW2011_GWA1_47_16]OGD00388.1 MAG: hypothetical protein A2972_03925 [Candidatus Amesbacteria bacterium RIFCSPLOWO2_01_FULL_47_33]OGD00924.1 MAG: hypothetical protein A2701_04860 [Candidatus Amesbacteria bacterium RIFCSPHIGHO2_01_FULL_47_34]